jgi:hypothetical protein
MSGAGPTRAGRERRPFWSRALRIVGFAALVGPLIGGTAFLALALFADAATRGITQADVIATLTLGPTAIALWGYALGLPPAAGAGLIFAVADALAPPRTPRWLLATAIGAATTDVYFALMAPPRANGGERAGAALFAVIGALAAFACWRISEWLGLTTRRPIPVGAPH